MLFALRLAALALAAVSVAGESCPNGWTGFQGRCYWRSTYTIEWTVADQLCEAIQPGSQQVSVHNLVHDAFIAETLLDGDRAWLGLQRVDSVWSWSDGTLVDWHYWFCDEPGPTGDRCVITNYAGTGQWGTYSCDDPHYFVCQIDAADETVLQM